LQHGGFSLSDFSQGTVKFQEVLMHKKLLLGAGFVIVIFVAGLGFIMSKNSIGLGEALGSLKELNTRVVILIALPFIVVLYVAVNYLRKKNEERKWKHALLKTRAKNLGNRDQ
jgi:hypothetical protein